MQDMKLLHWITGTVMLACVAVGGTAPAATQSQHADTQADCAARSWAAHFGAPYSRAPSGLVLALSGLGCGGRDVVDPHFAGMSEDTIGYVEECLGTRVDRLWSVVVTNANMEGQSPIEEHAHFCEKGRRAIGELSMTGQELEEAGLAAFEHHVVHGELRGSLGRDQQIYGMLVEVAWREDLRRLIVLVPLGVAADAVAAAAAAEAVANSMSAAPPLFGVAPLGASGPVDCAALQQLCYDAAYLRYKACAKNAQAIGVACLVACAVGCSATAVAYPLCFAACSAACIAAEVYQLSACADTLAADYLDCDRARIECEAANSSP